MSDFVALLKRHCIERVIDVRGQPYSRRNPQFDREAFAGDLKQHSIEYVWAGEHLSGRPRDPKLYGSDGKVLWDKVKRRTEFNAALDAIAVDAARTRLVLVCAEEDPRRCHRRFLLTPPLEGRGVEVLHVRGDGAVEPEPALHSRSAGAPPGQQDLFD